eukprot:74325_1
MATKSTISTSIAPRNGNASTSYLWKYVTVATNYVGLTTKPQHKKALTQSEPNLHTYHTKKKHNNKHNKRAHSNGHNHNHSKHDLYSEIGVECLNYLARLLDCTRPRLNSHKIVGEASLSLMHTNYVLLIEIFTFLPFDNIITIINASADKSYYQLALSCDYLLYNDLSGHQYIRDCCLNGYSFQNRNIVWPYLVCNTFDIAQYHKLYAKYTSHVDYFRHGLIDKDIDRTLIINYDDNNTYKYDYYSNTEYISRHHDVLNDAYKSKLRTILSIYCMLDPEVGYIQGMNYIAANVLIALHGNVDNAFAVFCHLMKRDASPPYYIDIDASSHVSAGFQSHAYCGGGRISKAGCLGYGLRDLYLPSLPGLIICLLQFEKLIKTYLPKLYQYFITQDIQVTNYASEWFLSLFSYILPLNLWLRIIDIFICDGWKTLHRAGLALLYVAKFRILKNEMGFDKILLLLKRKDLLQYLNINENMFIRLAMSFDVSNTYLHECAVELLAKSMARHTANHYSTLTRKR